MSLLATYANQITNPVVITPAGGRLVTTERAADRVSVSKCTPGKMSAVTKACKARQDITKQNYLAHFVPGITTNELAKKARRDPCAAGRWLKKNAVKVEGKTGWWLPDQVE